MRNKLAYNFYYKRNLPHYQPKGSTFFVTYRLAFSLPKVILNELAAKRNEFDKKLKTLPDKKKKIQKLEFNKMLFNIEDSSLDKYKNGPLWLSNETIAQTVIDSLLFNHQKIYDLSCCLVMPNHVHVVLKPNNKKGDIPYALAEIMKNHKSFTAHEANKILKRKGQFWQQENYDHYIRDQKEFYRIINYILNNPVRAGLVENYQDWKYYWLNKNIFSLNRDD